MRVIAGQYRGRRLLGPPRGAAARPTSDRVREALFSIVGDRADGARVLDLFAGTGALGIEALSRGAAHATFVESDRGMCETIQTNLETLEVGPRAAVLKRDVRRALAQVTGPFDLVFVDPPYGHLLEREALAGLVKGGLLAPGALVVVEHDAREALALPDAVAAALGPGDTRNYGDTSVTCFTARGARAEARSEPMGRVAIYPGSFDPPTNGHFDIIHRATVLFDRLTVAVAGNARKNPLFTVEERVDLLRDALGDDPRVEVDVIDGLLVDYARRKGASAVIRGLRAVADFDYEFQMACMNHSLAPEVETVFLMTAQEHFFVSSSLVKEVAVLGGDVRPFLPPAVLARLEDRLAARRKG